MTKPRHFDGRHGPKSPGYGVDGDEDRVWDEMGTRGRSVEGTTVGSRVSRVSRGVDLAVELVSS